MEVLTWLCLEVLIPMHLDTQFLLAMREGALTAIILFPYIFLKPTLPLIMEIVADFGLQLLPEVSIRPSV